MASADSCRKRGTEADYSRLKPVGRGETRISVLEAELKMDASKTVKE